MHYAFHGEQGILFSLIDIIVKWVTTLRFLSPAQLSLISHQLDLDAIFTAVPCFFNWSLAFASASLWSNSHKFQCISVYNSSLVQLPQQLLLCTLFFDNGRMEWVLIPTFWVQDCFLSAIIYILLRNTNSKNGIDHIQFRSNSVNRQSKGFFCALTFESSHTRNVWYKDMCWKPQAV